MRGDALLLAITSFLGVTLVRPFVGLLVWTWFTLMLPHEEAYGLVRTLPLNLAIAVIAGFAWLVSREPKAIPRSLTMILIMVFLAWITFNAFFAWDPAHSWPYWNRTWKTFALGILLAIMLTNRVRFQALIWIIVTSLCYYGVKGGLFTILSGGTSRVFGPPASIIGDNNQLAVALLMTLPLVNYLRLHTEKRFLRWGLAATMGLLVVTVLGTYSRGGFIALTAVAIGFWFRSKKKWLYPAIAVVIALTAASFMPPEFWARIDTIEHPQHDRSFVGREQAWHVAYAYAISHFPLGAGIYGPQLPLLFHEYEPNAVPHAAHSIYFQVLGENGFMGLAIYLAIFASSVFDLRQIRRLTRGRSDLLWAHDLANMLQLSLLAFAVGGAALSMAYYDLFVINICVASVLRQYVSRSLAASTQPMAVNVLSSRTATILPPFGPPRA